MLTTTQAPARTIVTLMFFASGVALVENEVDPTKGDKVSGTKIIMGFTIGTVFLTLLASAGETASSYAVGLAAITLASSVLIYGSQLAGTINKLTGSTGTPTTPTTSTPSTATATTPTKGT
jgi:hypothetical protein